MRCLALVVIPLVLCPSAWTQESRAAIVGRVMDTTGAVIAGAAIIATNQSTNVAAPARANEQGNYQILFLNPGVYRVSVAAPGFKTFERGDIQLRLSDRVNLDINLEVGDVRE